MTLERAFGVLALAAVLVAAAIVGGQLYAWSHFAYLVASISLTIGVLALAVGRYLEPRP